MFLSLSIFSCQLDFQGFSINFLKINCVLMAELGVVSWRLKGGDDFEDDENLKKIREARGYTYTVCHLR